MHDLTEILMEAAILRGKGLEVPYVRIAGRMDDAKAIARRFADVFIKERTGRYPMMTFVPHERPTRVIYDPDADSAIKLVEVMGPLSAHATAYTKVYIDTVSGFRPMGYYAAFYILLYERDGAPRCTLKWI